MNVSVILVAGGKGTRLPSPVPKQYLLLEGTAVARRCLNFFLQVPEVKEIIVVCDPAYHSFFESCTFAPPGKRRQDSVYNGLQCVQQKENLICIHDSARPFIPPLASLFEAAREHGAATLALPVTYTIKETSQEKFVTHTLPREKLWEIQTPQVAKYDLLQRGFQKAIDEDLTVTDDVSLVELLNHPVMLVEGSPKNIKITTKEDWLFANYLITHEV